MAFSKKPWMESRASSGLDDGSPAFYWKIMLPGALVGAIVGYVVMRYGKPPQPVEA